MAKVESIKSDKDTSDNLTSILKVKNQDKKDWLKDKVKDDKNVQLLQSTFGPKTDQEEFEMVKIPLFHYRQLLETSDMKVIAKFLFEKVSQGLLERADGDKVKFESYYRNMEDFQKVNSNVLEPFKSSRIHDKTITGEHIICKNWSIMVCEYLKLVCAETNEWKIDKKIASDRTLTVILKEINSANTKVFLKKSKRLTDR